MKTIDILRGTYGSVAIPFEAVCREIGVKLQTGRNALAAKKFPVPTYLEGSRRFAHIRHVAEYLDRQALGAEATAGRRRVGRPTNRSKLSSASALSA